MTSLAAEAVAHRVIEKVRRGQIPNISKLAQEQGYSIISSNSNKVQKTKTYKDIIARANNKITKRLDAEIERIQFALAEKDLTKERYATLNQALATHVHNKQLLTGGKTNTETPVPIF